MIINSFPQYKERMNWIAVIDYRALTLVIYDSKLVYCLSRHIKILIGTLEGQSHEFCEILFFFFSFLLLTMFKYAFEMINQNFNVGHRVISKIECSQFFVMYTKLVPCFCLHGFNILVKDFFFIVLPAKSF